MTRQDSQQMRASFDLTDFGSADEFRELCDEFDLEETWPELFDDGYEWVSAEGAPPIRLHTYCHPISGERYGIPNRPNEPGYASYIHIEGSAGVVEALYRAISERAESVKDKFLGRWIV